MFDEITAQQITAFIFTYFVTWWITIFFVLPFGAKPPGKVEKGHAASAPEKPRLKIKAIINSVLALVVTILISYMKQG